MLPRKIFIIIMVLIICLSQVTSDLYAPSLPAIAAYFGTSTSLVQWTIAIYMFGMAFSQLIYGALSDAYGRRYPLLSGLAIMLIGSLICIKSTTIYTLILGRFIQGCGAGASASLWRSIFRDLFEGADMSKYGAYLSLLVTFIIPAAPVLGGYLQQWVDWRANFYFIFCYTLFVFIFAYFFLTETSKHHHKDHFRMKFIIQSYSELLSNRVFLANTLCAFLCYGAFFAWYTVGPILLIQHIGISPSAFGWVNFTSCAIAMLIGSRINAKYVGKLGTEFMLHLGWVVLVLGGLFMLVNTFLVGLNLYGIIIPLIIYQFGGALITSNVFAQALAPFAKRAGYAGAGYGFIQTMGAALMSALVAHLPDDTQLPLAILYTLAPLLACAIYYGLLRKRGQA